MKAEVERWSSARFFN